MQFYVYYSSSFCTDHNHRHNITVRCHCPSRAGITDGEDEQDGGGRLCPTIGRGVRRGGGDGSSRTPSPGPEVDGRWQGSVLDAVRVGNGQGDRGKRENEPPLSDETRFLGEGVNGRRRRPTAALDEADAVIGDGALAGIAVRAGVDLRPRKRRDGMKGCRGQSG